MVHYLTHTYPYLNNPWPWTYDAVNLENHFMKAENDIDVLPVILRNKSVIAGWQYQDPEWDDENSSDQSNFSTKKVKLIHDFQNKYNYYVVWENDLFQILKSDMQPIR